MKRALGNLGVQRDRLDPNRGLGVMNRIDETDVGRKRLSFDIDVVVIGRLPALGSVRAALDRTTKLEGLLLRRLVAIRLGWSVSDGRFSP